jgi:glycosyltransferase involved in cell wall biosynthesis
VIGRLVFAVPGDLSTPTGGYAYDRRMITELEQFAQSIAVLDLGEGFPRPDPAIRTAALTRLAAVPPDCPVLIDGLALGVLPEIAALRHTHRLIALVHHPLALESGLSEPEIVALCASERAALAAVRHVVTTSQTVARILIADYGVPEARITIAPPGTDRAPAARGSGEPAVVLLAVGAITARKGYDVLVAALGMVRAPAWRLTIVGDRRRDPAASTRLEADIARLGLSDRIALVGAISQAHLEALYDSADLFVLASRFEGYGMAFADAMARGLPMIGTIAGAIPETAPGALLVPPDNAAALAAALDGVIGNRRARRRLAAASRRGARDLPAWSTSARVVAKAVAGTCGDVMTAV